MKAAIYTIGVLLQKQHDLAMKYLIQPMIAPLMALNAPITPEMRKVSHVKCAPDCVSRLCVCVY